MFSGFQEMINVKLWAKNQGQSLAFANVVLSQYINSMSWKPGERVLDMGCGPGIVTTEALLPRLPEDFSVLVGADLSADMVQYASENYTHPKLRFTQFDLLKDLGFTSQLLPSDFDKIFSFFCLHWVPDHRYYLAIKTKISFLKYFHFVLLNDIVKALTHTFSFRRFEESQHPRNITNYAYLPLSTS
jgi:SAM-dependent methyltransferase